MTQVQMSDFLHGFTLIINPIILGYCTERKCMYILATVHNSVASLNRHNDVSKKKKNLRDCMQNKKLFFASLKPLTASQ